MPTRKLSFALALALAIVLVNAAWSFYQWQDLRESGSSRLLATSHTRRYVENPGIEAWLVNLLERAGGRLSARDQVVFEGIMKEVDELADLPPCMASYAEQLLATPAPTSAHATLRDAPPPASGLPADTMRSVQYVDIAGETLVLTRRRSLSTSEVTLAPELEQAAAHLIALAHAWDHDEPREWLTDRTLIASPPQLVRLFAVVEDGSVLTLPIARSGGPTLEDEKDNLWRRPREPSLASIVVFEPHDFSRPRAQEVHYTGIYPDKLGQGFVATLAVPGVHRPGRLKHLIAADLGLAISPERLVEAADPSMQLAAAHLPSERKTQGPSWQPWVTLLSALPTDAPRELLLEVHEHALLETQQEQRIEWEPLVFERTDRGVLFATQLAQDYWLVGLVEEPPLPWPSMLLAPILLLGLVVGVERRRRAAALDQQRREASHRVRDAALDELEPVVVVDPNDDRIVHANLAAKRELGLAAGQIVHEQLVAADPRSQRQYRDFQLAGGPRRAYGVRLRDHGRPDAPRFALVRSISLREPVPELHAAANHRLALVSPIAGEADLDPVLEDELAAARQDERNKLATILEHGVDLFARVLATALRSEDPRAIELARGLADYLQGRLQVTQWILDRWGSPSTREVECILGPEHLRAALALYRQLFARVEADPRLRAQLHWNNGTLARPIAGEIVEAWIDWPDEYRVTTPIEGLFGYFVGEVLVNAIKHGTPGLAIALEVDIDRARRELCVRVRNPSPTAQAEPHDQAYGGSAILAEIARVCGWQLTRERRDDEYELRWTCPVTLQRAPGLAD